MTRPTGRTRRRSTAASRSSSSTDAYARTLDPEDGDEYVAEFNQIVIDRLPRFGLEIEDV
jgi:hypothetical protein